MEVSIPCYDRFFGSDQVLERFQIVITHWRDEGCMGKLGLHCYVIVMINRLPRMVMAHHSETDQSPASQQTFSI